jgi:hypothetical protein
MDLMVRLLVSLLPALMVRFLLKVMVYRPVLILLADPLVLLFVALVVRQLTLISPYLVLMALHLPMVLHPVRLYLRGLPPLDACHNQLFPLVVDRNLRLLDTSKALFLQAGPLVRLPLPLLLLHRPVIYLRSQRLSWQLRSRWSRSRCWVK